MKKYLILDKVREYLNNKMLYGALFLLCVCAVFLYILMGTNMFLVSVDGHDKAVLTMRKDMQGVIDLCNITLAEDDVVEFREPDDITAGALNVRRAFYVNVTADNVTETISVIEGTVRDALEQCGITMNEFDEVSPGLDTHLYGDMDVRVKRVYYRTHVTEEKIPYTTHEYKSVYHVKGTRTVTTKGENGKRTTTYKDKYEDGVLTGSVAISVSTTKKPVTEEIAIGASTEKLIDKYSVMEEEEKKNNGAPAEYSKMLTFQATAYSYSSNSRHNTTACGTPVRPGVAAVDPKVIPYGTVMYIESADGKHSYGYYIAEDTGVRGNRIDLFMATERECERFGRRNVNIYIVG